MVITGRRVRTATGSGTIAALILVLAFGNPAYTDWSRDHANTGTAGGYLLRLLAWPGWHIKARDGSAGALRDLLAGDLKAILVVAFTALLLSVAAGSLLASGQGTVGALLAGWGCFILAAALAGFLAAFVAVDASLLQAMHWASEGATYGLFFGWIVGLATATSRR